MDKKLLSGLHSHQCFCGEIFLCQVTHPASEVMLCPDCDAVAGPDEAA